MQHSPEFKARVALAAICGDKTLTDLASDFGIQQINIEKATQKVLDARALFPNSSLAELYNPVSMPPELVKAHNELDIAVDLAYRPQPFVSEANSMEFLFELYEKYTADLFTNAKMKKKRVKLS